MRKDLFLNLLYKSIDKYGEDLGDKLLEEIIEEFNISKINPLTSSSILYSFPLPLLNGNIDKNCYLLKEGNGRICAYKSAIDIIKEKHIKFIPPKIEIRSLILENKIAITNQAYFLYLNWMTTFFNVELEGWVIIF
jgi:hypothetical protein